MIRWREIEKWWRLRRFVEDPWGVATARRRVEPGTPLAIKLRGLGEVTIRAGTSDHRVLDDVFLNDVYHLGPHLGGERPLGTVMDVGGHVGLFAIRASSIAERVITFEPFPENFSLLERNLATAGVENVRAFKIAVGAENGVTVIHRSTNRAGHSLFSSLAPGEGIPAAVISLARAFEEAEVDRCDLLKIDGEGAEYPILLNAEDEILERIERVELEYHDLGGDPPDFAVEPLARRLEEAGFRVTRNPSRRNPARGSMRALRVG